MKPLAEFVMRGRPQALAVAVASSASVLFCWIGAAVVALVTLRRGAASGAWLMLWALLPAGTLALVFGDSGPLTLLAGTFVLAAVLRATVNLPLAVLASVAVGAVTGLLLLALGGHYLDQIVAYFSEFLANMEKQLSSSGGEPVVLPRPVAGQIAGLLGAGTAMMSVLCLFLARYWQAALYHPGGFGEEFRALRYPVTPTLGLVAVALVLSALGDQYRTWAMIFFIPLTFAGLALVHARVAQRGQGSGWLGVFYAAWLVFDPVKLLVVFFAIADSWMNFRARWAGKAGRAVAPPRDEDSAQGTDHDRDSDNDRDSKDQ